MAEGLRHWPHGIFILMYHCSLWWLCLKMNGYLFSESLQNEPVKHIVQVVILLVGYFSQQAESVKH